MPTENNEKLIEQQGGDALTADNLQEKQPAPIIEKSLSDSKEKSDGSITQPGSNLIGDKIDFSQLRQQESDNSSPKPKVMTADEYYGPKLSEEIRQNGGLMWEDMGVTMMNVHFHQKIYGFRNLYALEFSYANDDDKEDDRIYKAYIKGLRTRPKDIVRVTEGELNELTELIANEPEANRQLAEKVSKTASLNGLEYNERYKTFKNVQSEDFENIINFVKGLKPREIIRPTTSWDLNQKLLCSNEK